MRDLLITIGSITYAMKAKKLLSSKLIRSRIIKAGTSDRSGCLYGIMISPKDKNAAVDLLLSEKISFSI